MNLILRNIIPLCFILANLSCNKGEKKEANILAQGPTYFSIKDFAKDQWSTFHGQPVAVQQISLLNGHADTQMVSALQMKWSVIFKVFFETDISDPKFLNQYDFSTFEESMTQSRTFLYEAKDPKSYTQKLQITVDYFTNKVRNIYIETQEQSVWNMQTKKLLYSPMRVIQIQEHNDPLIGRQKDLVIEYKFM